MIQNAAEWEAWERERLRSEPVNIERNFALLDAMYEQARALGLFPPADPLEGLAEKIQIIQRFHGKNLSLAECEEIVNASRLKARDEEA